MKKLITSLSMVLLILAPILSTQTAGATGTPFNPNNLIDDFTYNDTGSMSPSSIDSWLNINFPSSCISPNANSNGNAGFTTPDPQGWSSSQNKYLFGSNVTAGNAIYDIAQNYDINPQVILTTLQKEQSIIAGGAGCYSNTPNPSAPFSGTPGPNNTFTCTIGNTSTTCTYACVYSGGCMNIAMSYGCPGYCKAADEGFSLQLTLGSWVLRFSQERAYGILTGYPGYDNGDQYFTYTGPMTAGYRQRTESGASIYYDGTYTTSDGIDVTIANGATASLYTFTPTSSANEKFDNLFQGNLSDGDLGFGSVIATDSFTPHPNGTLVASGNRVYLINNNAKEWVAGGDIFPSYNYSWSAVKTGTTGDANLPTGPSITTLAPGAAFYSDGTPVYVMTSQSGSPVKQQISYASFIGLGYNWNTVVHVSPGSIPPATAPGILFSSAQHPAGSLVVDQSTGKVYLLNEASKSWILGPIAFLSNNFNWQAVMNATPTDLSLPDGTPIDIAQGTMLYSGGSIYVVSYDTNGILKQPVGPWECFANRWHYSLNNTYSVPPASLPARTGSLATC